MKNCSLWVFPSAFFLTLLIAPAATATTCSGRGDPIETRDSHATVFIGRISSSCGGQICTSVKVLHAIKGMPKTGSLVPIIRPGGWPANWKLDVTILVFTEGNGPLYFVESCTATDRVENAWARKALLAYGFPETDWPKLGLPQRAADEQKLIGVWNAFVDELLLCADRACCDALAKRNRFDNKYVDPWCEDRLDWATTLSKIKTDSTLVALHQFQWAAGYSTLIFRFREPQGPHTPYTSSPKDKKDRAGFVIELYEHENWRVYRPYFVTERGLADTLNDNRFSDSF